MAFLKIAHRGSAGSRPEHTRPAFERAIELGVDMIELDVQLTRDQRLVVLHDLELGRTVPGRGAVRHRCLEDLRAMDAGAWFGAEYAGEHVLSLDEVLELTVGRVALNTEIKSPEADWVATAGALIECLQNWRSIETTIISSFQMGALHAVREAAPGARLGVLWRRPDVDRAWAHADAFGATSIHPLWTLVDASLVRKAHESELAVLAWTVNDIDTMEWLENVGVDGIISDFPERFSERKAG